MKTGTSTGTVYVSPSRARRWAKRRQREEEEWAARSGPVVVTNLRDRNREILPTDHEILPSQHADK